MSLPGWVVVSFHLSRMLRNHIPEAMDTRELDTLCLSHSHTMTQHLAMEMEGLGQGVLTQPALQLHLHLTFQKAMGPAQ